MGIDDSLIDEIIKRTLRVAKPKRIILFGSAATGQMDPDSDIDLLVLKDGIVDIRRERSGIRKALQGLEFPFDVFVMESENFEESKDVIGGIAYPANKYGRVIFDEDKAGRKN